VVAVVVVDSSSASAGLTISARSGPGNAVVLDLTGFIDLSNVQSLADAISKALAHASDLTVDLTGLTFLDSTGLREFAAGYQQAEASGVGFRVVNAQGTVLAVLRIAGMYDYLNDGVRPT
jgi:anti-sigma B factor antagonist